MGLKLLELGLSDGVFSSPEPLTLSLDTNASFTCQYCGIKLSSAARTDEEIRQAKIQDGQTSTSSEKLSASSANFAYEWGTKDSFSIKRDLYKACVLCTFPRFIDIFHAKGDILYLPTLGQNGISRFKYITIVEDLLASDETNHSDRETASVLTTIDTLIRSHGRGVNSSNNLDMSSHNESMVELNLMYSQLLEKEQLSSKHFKFFHSDTPELKAAVHEMYKRRITK